MNKKGIWINTDKLLIINEHDRPCIHLICREMPNGRILYACKKLRRKYPDLQKGIGAATLEEYGFIYNVFKKKYVLTNESKVKYPNGKPRRWQGKTDFTYEDIVNANLKSD